MLELLLSNFPFLQSKKTFSDRFIELFQEANEINIATGYISTDALTELNRIVELNHKNIKLIVGMHYFEGMTKVQYNATMNLGTYLLNQSLGNVFIADKLRFHGKIYTFHQRKASVYAGIIGSSNLDGILKNHNNYEADIFFNDPRILNQADETIDNLISTACIPIQDWHPNNFLKNKIDLDKYEEVKKCSSDEMRGIRYTDTVFELPIKPYEHAPHSNINAYFGKGRENKRGFIQPRHWYEVELIVPKSITDDSMYPKAKKSDEENIITVYTDDNWKFKCKISGDYSKNFRSCNDLKILGKWIKGRLENNAALEIGKPVTEEVLKKYGRNSIEMRGTADPSVWFLDFSSPNEGKDES